MKTANKMFLMVQIIISVLLVDQASSAQEEMKAFELKQISQNNADSTVARLELEEVVTYALSESFLPKEYDALNSLEVESFESGNISIEEKISTTETNIKNLLVRLAEELLNQQTHQGRNWTIIDSSDQRRERWWDFSGQRRDEVIENARAWNPQDIVSLQRVTARVGFHAHQ